MPSKYHHISGWFNFPTVYAQSVNRAKSGDVFVEVGAWLGKSTCFMAEAIAESGKNIGFYAVDTWGGAGGEPDQMRIVEASGGSVYEQFMQNITSAGVASLVKPVPSDSVEAAHRFAFQSCQFIFIDGDHTYEAVRADLAAWYPRLAQDGVMAGHDYDQGQVRQAVDEFFAAYDRPVEAVRDSGGCCWRVGQRSQARIAGKAHRDYGRVFDCFTFYDELDILEIRLRELSGVVDEFVLVESPFDFRGRAKPLVFLDYMDTPEGAKRFEPWVSMIRHVTANNSPLQSLDMTSDEVWDNEGYQRNAIAIALDDCDPGDLIIVSDVDEIPMAGSIGLIPRDGKPTRLDLDVFHYNFNLLDRNNNHYTCDACAVAFSSFTTACDLRGCSNNYHIAAAGWHLTWFGGAEKIEQKVSWYSHPLLEIENAAGMGTDTPLVLTEGKPLEYVTDLSNLPQFVQENLPRFRHLFDPRYIAANEGLF